MSAESLGELISGLPPILPESPHSNAAIERIIKSSITNNYRDKLSRHINNDKVAAFLGSALGDSPYLLACAERDTAALAEILDQSPQAWAAGQIQEVAALAAGTKAEIMGALRVAKRRLALGLGLADLAGVAPLEFVTGTLSDFADEALNAALGFALREAAGRNRWQGGGPETSGLAIIAMGKYGAYELNYSSDIDIVAFFDPNTPGVADGVEPAVFWVRIVREIVGILQERTADGYVFRVDLRLRPDPGATAVAISMPAALQYYESMGQNWERAAMIKARAAAGDTECGAAFLQEIAPFIWRKHLDFAAIADIHSIKRQIHAHRGHGVVRVAGHDIKRGRGGIREIELFVQTQQLIAGGRDPQLRLRQTRRMLKRLEHRDWIGARERREMDEAYEFLRRLEHRLQMVRDEQTHTIPENPDEIARIGRLSGHADTAAFQSAVKVQLETVAAHYSRLFEAEESLSAEEGNLVFTGDDDDPDTLKTLEQLGYKDPAAVTRTVRAWHFGRYAATRSTAARENLTEFTPDLLRALAGEGDPDAAFRAFDELIRGLPAGVQFFALLASNRPILHTISLMMGAAPRLAESLARHPNVIDALIDPAVMSLSADRATYADWLSGALQQAEGYEDALDRARRFVSEQKFVISIRLLSGLLSPENAAVAYSELAEAVSAGLFDLVRAEFARRHGKVPGGRAALLAFGRLGSMEMTAGSDLDLIIIYDHDPEATQSDGEKPLMTSQYFTRLTQRFVAALSAPTAEGIAYEVDLRMRPSGQSGPLATHIEAFARYQTEDAWTWEHMALCRARVVGGNGDMAPEIHEIINTVLTTKRDPKKLKADIWEMRTKVEEGRPAATRWDLKLFPGGLMDLEFLAQFFTLAGNPRRPGEQLQRTFKRLAAENGIDVDIGAELAHSAQLQSALFQTLRAVVAGDFRIGEAPPGLLQLLDRVATTTLQTDSEHDEMVMNSSDTGKPVSASIANRLEDLLAMVQDATRARFREILGPREEA